MKAQFQRSDVRHALSPELSAARIFLAVENSESISVADLMAVLKESAEAINRDDLTEVEAMLVNQAVALQTIFVKLTSKAMSAGHLPNFEAFMRLALRSQNQCRATLETLATIKNPPLVYARQANVTTRPQQVNNGVAPPLCAGENLNQLSKLSGEGDGNELLAHARASSHESQFDCSLETMGEVKRAAICRR